MKPKNANDYVKMRRQLLQKMRTRIYERNKINNDIGSIRRLLNNLDDEILK